MSTQSIYIDLECLLDTRMAALCLHSGLSPKHIVEKGYKKRDTDDATYLGIDNTTFSTFYSERGNTVLHNTVMTNLVFFLKTFIEEVRKESSFAMINQPISITVNTYPYQLTVIEKDVLCNVICNHIGIIKIDTAFIPRHLQTPMFFKQGYRTVFMYEFRQWYLTFHTTLIKTPMPTVTVYCPRLLPDLDLQETHKEDIAKDQDLLAMSKNFNVYDTMSMLLVEYLNIQYLDIQYFCLLDTN